MLMLPGDGGGQGKEEGCIERDVRAAIMALQPGEGWCGGRGEDWVDAMRSGEPTAPRGGRQRPENKKKLAAVRPLRIASTVVDYVFDPDCMYSLSHMQKLDPFMLLSECTAQHSLMELQVINSPPSSRLHSNGEKGHPARPDREAHRRRRPSFAFASGRSSIGKQRCQVNGLLQGPSPSAYHLDPALLTLPLQEFNARTANYVTGTPVPARVTVRPDRSFTFEIRTPPTASLLLAAAGVSTTKNKVRGAGNTAGPKAVSAVAKGRGSSTSGNAAISNVGQVSLKHVYEIAQIKASETRLSGVGVESLVRSVVAQAASMGVSVVP
nr:54s ribosomal protein l19, mitochondrial [Quercus suber]